MICAHFDYISGSAGDHAVTEGVSESESNRELTALQKAKLSFFAIIRMYATTVSAAHSFRLASARHLPLGGRLLKNRAAIFSLPLWGRGTALAVDEVPFSASLSEGGPKNRSAIF